MDLQNLSDLGVGPSLFPHGLCLTYIILVFRKYFSTIAVIPCDFKSFFFLLVLIGHCHDRPNFGVNGW